MNYTPNKGFPAGNPIANAVVIIIGLLTVAASVVLGFFAFLVLASLVLVVAAIIGIRTLWYRRVLRSTSRPAGAPGTDDARRSKSGTNVIEGEFRVVGTGRDRERD